MTRIIGSLALSAILILTLVQPAMAQESKPGLSFEDYKQIMELADRVEAAVLIPDALLLVEITRPEHGLFLDLLSDSKDAVLVEIPYSGIPDMFNDFEDRYWGPHDAADFDLHGVIPYVLLCGSLHLEPSYPEVDKNRYSQILSLPDAFARYDSKEIDRLTAEPANHFFVYEEEHYVQYYVQSPINEVNGEFWFLIIDQDEHGWFLKGITHMERWSI